MLGRRNPDSPPPIPIPPIEGDCPDCGLRMQSHPPERLKGSHPALCLVAKTRVVDCEE